MANIPTRRDFKEQNWLNYETQKSRVASKLNGEDNIEDGIKSRKQLKIIGIVLIIGLIVFLTIAMIQFVLIEF